MRYPTLHARVHGPNGTDPIYDVANPVCMGHNSGSWSVPFSGANTFIEWDTFFESTAMNPHLGADFELEAGGTTQINVYRPGTYLLIANAQVTLNPNENIQMDATGTDLDGSPAPGIFSHRKTNLAGRSYEDSDNEAWDRVGLTAMFQYDPSYCTGGGVAIGVYLFLAAGADRTASDAAVRIVRLSSLFLDGSVIGAYSL